MVGADVIVDGKGGIAVPETDLAQDVRLPRKLWAEFLLHYCTMGLYTPFWLAGRVRELRQLSDARFTPWLWFFVPFFALLQLFALPRLTHHVRELEIHHGISPWGHSRYLWILAALTITVLFTRSTTSVSMPFWSIWVGTLVWAGLFVVLAARFNAVRRGIRGADESKPDQGLRWWEWVVVAATAPIAFVFVPYQSYQSLGLNDVLALPAHEVYQDPDGRFQFPIAAEGWAVVTPGTFSEDEALVEMRGPAEELFAVVYHYRSQTLEEVMDDRRFNAQQALTSARCHGTRKLVSGTLDVAAQIVCEGRELWDPSIITSSAVETPEGIYELVVYMSTPKLTFKELKDGILHMTQEFQPL